MKQRIIVAVIGIPLLLAILCVAPDWATAALRPPASSRQTVRQAGTSMFSAVCSALASTRPPSTGHRMSHSRRDTSLGGRGAVLPKQRAASRR